MENKSNQQFVENSQNNHLTREVKCDKEIEVRGSNNEQFITHNSDVLKKIRQKESQ